MLIKRQILKPVKTYRFERYIMNFQILGKGKPVVLLHGSMNNNPWNGFDRLLSKHYQVYRPDLPGFGASETINNHLHNTELFAEVFSRFIEINHLEKAPVIALSLGTIVALKSAASGSIKGKLILIGVPTIILGPQSKRLNIIPLFLKRLMASTEFGRKKLILPILRENSAILKKNSYLFDQELYQAMLTTDAKAIVDVDYYQDVAVNLPPLINQVKNPIVFIYGENDPHKVNFKRYRKTFIKIPHLGHNIFAENPLLSLSIIKKYL